MHLTSVSAPPGAPDRHGQGAGLESLCLAESQGAGRGSLGLVDGNCERPRYRTGARKNNGRRWAGSDIGVRSPDPGETPLSRLEVLHGLDHGLIDGLPIRRVFKPVGEWERKGVKHLAKATPFDGLLA